MLVFLTGNVETGDGLNVSNIKKLQNFGRKTQKLG